MKSTRILLCLGGILILLSCRLQSNKQEVHKADAEQLVSQISDNETTINLNSLSDNDTIFDAHKIIGSSYVSVPVLKLSFKTDAEIIEAFKTTRFYPTIWAGANVEAIQFVYLFDHEVPIVEKLRYDKREVYYPIGIPQNVTLVNSTLGKITKRQVLGSIKKIPEMYYRKATDLSFEYNDWKKERSTWNHIADKYHIGKFVDEDNEPFDYDPYEMELHIKFKTNSGKIFEVVLKDEAIIGN